MTKKLSLIIILSICVNINNIKPDNQRCCKCCCKKNTDQPGNSDNSKGIGGVGKKNITSTKPEPIAKPKPTSYKKKSSISDKTKTSTDVINKGIEPDKFKKNIGNTEKSDEKKNNKD